MCAVIGAMLTPKKAYDVVRINSTLSYISRQSLNRGRDGFGFSCLLTEQDYQIEQRVFKSTDRYSTPRFNMIGGSPFLSGTFIANTRAEPTTEYVNIKQEHDQQPYSIANVSIVHNGTISNDHLLRTGVYPSEIDSSAIVESWFKELGDVVGLATTDTVLASFKSAVSKLKGSFAILGTHRDTPDALYFACNYRPLWYIKTEYGVFFASCQSFFPKNFTPVMVEPYSYGVAYDGEVYSESFVKEKNKRALVVCSGGMDSTVAASEMISQGYEIELIHFLYGSRAEGPEVNAVKNIAEFFKVPVTLFPLPVYKQSDSPLLNPESKIAGGEAGAEFAHEWVPARNLVLLSVASAYAEANNFNTIVLGNNLEEAGAYPDNEPEFVNRFNKMLPFAVGDGFPLIVAMPVGNMMKHEIVSMGLYNGAPLHLTWSCYRAGELHCGKCGPCYMRRKSFQINGVPEVIKYEEEL